MKRLEQLEAAALIARMAKSLRQRNRTWEAAVRWLPTSRSQTKPSYIGLIVDQADGALLAEMQVEGKPKIGDLAELLGTAMRKPLIRTPHLPRRLNVGGRTQWEGLLPSLELLGIEFSSGKALLKAEAAYQRRLGQMRQVRRKSMVKPSQSQAAVEKLFPAITRWVDGCGHIEIGDQEGFGFTVRALDCGGIVFEDGSAETLAEAMAALEEGLAEFMEREGIE